MFGAFVSHGTKGWIIIWMAAWSRNYGVCGCWDLDSRSGAVDPEALNPRIGYVFRIWVWGTGFWRPFPGPSIQCEKGGK